MVRCDYCNKLILSSSKLHTYSNGKKYCDNCSFFYNKSNYIYDNIQRQILENFIEKYGTRPQEKELKMLHGLLERKYRISIHIKDLYNTLPWIKQRLDEDKELKNFEIDLKYNKIKDFYCCICKKTITKKQFEYSMNIFGKALCFQHQNEQKATSQAKKLFNALQYRKLDCKLEATDGHKSVDIAIDNAKMYIEIDGSHHSTNPMQLKADLERDYYSYNNGYVTKRLTNYQINNNLEEIADALSEVAKQRIKQFENNIINEEKPKSKNYNENIENIRENYPKAYMAWTDKEDALLRQFFNEFKTTQEIAKTLQRQPSAIRARLKKLGIIN